MKIKIAVLGYDIEFMERLSKIFQKKYTDKMSLILFSNEEVFYRNLETAHADLVLVDQSVKLELDKIPDRIVVGCLSNIPDVDEIEGLPAICKYQRVEEIYKMVLNLYAEHSSNIKIRKERMDGRLLLFTSVQGGCGVSAAAAAYAWRRAAEKKKVLYLNLERFGDPNLYFHGDGKLSFSDVIYTLKSKRGNLLMKMESVVQTDNSGVNFFPSCRNAYDMFELSDNEVQELVEEVSRASQFEEIVMDLSGELTDRMLMLMREYADRIIYVADGSATGNGKFERFCETVRVIEEREDCKILEKTSLLYNRYSSKHGVQLTRAAVPVIGGLHRFEGMQSRELIQELAQMDVLRAV